MSMGSDKLITNWRIVVVAIALSSASSGATLIAWPLLTSTGEQMSLGGALAFNGLYVLSSLSYAFGALAADRFAGTATTRGIALPALGLVAATMLLSAVAQGVPLLGLTAALALRFAAGLLIMLAAFTVIARFDANRPVALALMLGFGAGSAPALSSYANLEMASGGMGVSPMAGVYLIGGCALVVAFLAPSRAAATNAMLPFSPVGPSPIAYRQNMANAPSLLFACIAISLALWFGYRAASSDSQVTAVLDASLWLVALGVGISCKALGELSVVRFMILAITTGLALGLDAPTGPGPLGQFLAPAALMLAGVVSDFIALLLPSRYGQPTEYPRRAGLLMAAQPLTMAMLGLASVTGVASYWTGAEGVIAILGAGAAFLAIARLPRPRSAQRAW